MFRIGLSDHSQRVAARANRVGSQIPPGCRALGFRAVVFLQLEQGGLRRLCRSPFLKLLTPQFTEALPA
jgi:hypothetical protein